MTEPGSNIGLSSHISSQAAKDQGVTLLTITHRPTLAKFHTHLLQFDGQGGWNFSSFSSEVFTTLDEEKCQIEKSLAEVLFLNSFWLYPHHSLCFAFKGSQIGDKVERNSGYG